MTWPLAAQVTTAIPGDGFDGWQNAWNLWWLREAAVNRVQWPLFTDLLYYPTGVALYFHTLNPFNGLVSLPIQLAAGLLAAYNFVVLLSFTLSGYGAFLLASWVLRPHRDGPNQALTIRYGAALTAGVVFAYAPVHMAQLLGHMQVFAYQWLPFAVLYILRTLERSASGHRWLRDALLAGLFVALATLCDWYFALYLLLFSIPALVWCAGRGIRRGQGLASAWRPALALLVTGFTAGALVSPLLIPMAREALRADYMVRPAQDLYIYSASVVDFLNPSRMHSALRGSGIQLPGNQVAPVSEGTVAAGWLTLALAIAGLALRWKRALPWFLAALFFALLALGPRPALGNVTWEDIGQNPSLSEWSLYNLLNTMVPFMRISRSVSRFAIMVQPCLSVGAAIGLAALLMRRAHWSTPASAAAILVLIAEFWVVPYPMSPPDTPEFYRTLAGVDEERPAILNVPMNYDRPGYLLYQTVHGRPLTVAYISRDDPRTLTERVPVLQQLRHLGPDIIVTDVAEVGPTVLQDLGVGVVVLDRYKMPEGREREYTEEVAGLLFAGSEPAYADERLTVYETAPVAVPAAYLLLGAEGWGPLEEIDGVAVRRLAAEGAEVEIMHGSGDEQLRLRYRGEGALRVEGESTFASAPQGAEEVVDLHGRNTIRLWPEEGDVWIEGLALVAEE